MIELSNNLFNQNCTTKPVPQAKIIFVEKPIISERYNKISGDGGDEGDEPFTHLSNLTLQTTYWNYWIKNGILPAGETSCLDIMVIK